MLKKGKINIDEVSEYFPELLESDIKEIEFPPLFLSRPQAYEQDGSSVTVYTFLSLFYYFIPANAIKHLRIFYNLFPGS